VGVLILAVGISGIQQLGGAFFVEPLFNGVTLLIAIALAGFAQRRRSVTTRKPSITGLEPTRNSGTTSEREDGDGEVSPVS
jgi:ribose transport system permease protein